MPKAIRPFFVALQFLTVFPLQFSKSPTAAEWGKSILYYPLIGFLIGGVLASIAWLAATVETQLQSAFILFVWVGLTGALHLDGLADTVDGFAGGRGDRERTLEIMKDPRCGAMGVTSIVLILLLKYAALSVVLVTYPFALIVAPIIGRTLILPFFITTPYVRKQGLGADIAAHLPRLQTWYVIAVVCFLVVTLLGMLGLLLVAISFVVYIGFRSVVVHRIKGATGDTAGALVEITEVSVLCFIALATHSL